MPEGSSGGGEASAGHNRNFLCIPVASSSRALGVYCGTPAPPPVRTGRPPSREGISQDLHNVQIRPSLDNLANYAPLKLESGPSLGNTFDIARIGSVPSFDRSQPQSLNGRGRNVSGPSNEPQVAFGVDDDWLNRMLSSSPGARGEQADAAQPDQLQLNLACHDNVAARTDRSRSPRNLMSYPPASACPSQWPEHELPQSANCEAIPRGAGREPADQSVEQPVQEAGKRGARSRKECEGDCENNDLSGEEEQNDDSGSDEDFSVDNNRKRKRNAPSKAPGSPSKLRNRRQGDKPLALHAFWKDETASGVRLPTQYKGVSFMTRTRLYEASINIPGEHGKPPQVAVGGWTTEEDAARARDMVCVAFQKPTKDMNFPPWHYKQEQEFVKLEMAKRNMTKDSKAHHAFAKKMVEKIKAGSCGVMKAEARKAGPQGPIDTNLALLLHNVVRQDDSKTLGIFQTKEAAMAAVDEEIVRSMGLHAVTNRPINNYMHLLGQSDQEQLREEVHKVQQIKAGQAEKKRGRDDGPKGEDCNKKSRR